MSPPSELGFLILCLFLAPYVIAGPRWPANIAAIDCDRNPLTCEQPPVNLTSIKSVLVVVAHPDDESCGSGTMANLISHGSVVNFVYLTNGDSGSQNRSITRAENAAIRQNEVRNAVRALGGGNVHFLEYPDGDLQNTYVITWNPNRHVTWYNKGVEHADHRTAGAIVLDSAYPLSHDPLYFFEQVEAGVGTWRPNEVWLFSWKFESDDPSSNYAHELTQDDIKKKARSLYQHRSQVKGSLDDVLESVSEAAMKLGNIVNVQYAEWFVRVIEMPN